MSYDDLIPVPPHLWHLTILSPFLRVPFPSQFLQGFFFSPVALRTVSSQFNRPMTQPLLSGPLSGRPQLGFGGFLALLASDRQQHLPLPFDPLLALLRLRPGTPVGSDALSEGIHKINDV